MWVGGEKVIISNRTENPWNKPQLWMKLFTILLWKILSILYILESAANAPFVLLIRNEKNEATNPKSLSLFLIICLV